MIKGFRAIFRGYKYKLLVPPEIRSMLHEQLDKMLDADDNDVYFRIWHDLCEKVDSVRKIYTFERIEE